MKFYLKFNHNLVLLGLIIFFSISGTKCLGQDIRTERVAFSPGSSSASIEDSISGRETVDYLLNVREGQNMNVSMASENGGIYFNIMEPGEEYVAIYNGSVMGNQYEGTTAKHGDYRIRVYLMKGARNTTANYRLEMVVNGTSNK